LFTILPSACAGHSRKLLFVPAGRARRCFALRTPVSVRTALGIALYYTLF